MDATGFRRWARRWAMLGAVVVVAGCGPAVPTGPQKPCNPAAPEMLSSFKAEPATFAYGENFKLKWEGPCGWVAVAQKGYPQFALGRPSSGTYEMKLGRPGYPTIIGTVVYEASNGDLATPVRTTVTVNPGKATCPNGSCDSGETQGSCCADCGCPNGQQCVSGRCQPGGGSCPNQTCGTDENCSTCPQDCPCPSGQQCVSGICQTGCPEGQACTDANACTSGDTCRSGLCQSGAAINCADNSPCTIDSCSPSTGCQHAAYTCPACQSCNGTGGCVAVPGTCCGDGTCAEAEKCSCVADCNGQSCNDGNACTQGSKCQSNGTCAGGTAVDCADTDPCTVDSCDPSTGCRHAPYSCPACKSCDGTGGCVPSCPNKAPTVTVSVSSATCHPTPTASCAVTCTATASDPDDDPLTYAWSGCATGSGSSPRACTVASLAAVTCQVSVADGRGGTATGSATVTGTNQSPSCVANNGRLITVWSLSWTDPIDLAISDPDGDSIPGCTSVGSSRPDLLGIGPFRDCATYAPRFTFRPSCVAGEPTSVSLVVHVTDAWGAEGVCYAPMECWQ